MRQWWIEFEGDPINDKNGDLRYVNSIAFDPCDLDAEAVHVVEYSELEKAQASLAVAVEALKDTKWNIENDMSRCMSSFIDEALAKIESQK